MRLVAVFPAILIAMILASLVFLVLGVANAAHAQPARHVAAAPSGPTSPLAFEVHTVRVITQTDPSGSDD